MADIERVRAWFASGSLVRPDASLPNTVDLACAIAARTGTTDVEQTAGSRRIAGLLGPARHIVFVMADGLGMNLIERMPADSFFRRHLAMELRAVFPSSTAPALTSLATCRWPADHAVPAWFTYLPDEDLIATILPYIERFSHRPLAELGVQVRRAIPLPSRLTDFMHDPLCYLPSAIAGSTYSNYVSGGRPQRSYRHLTAAVEAIAARVESARAATYSYLYVPMIDAAEHEHGPFTKPVNRSLVGVQRAIERLAARISPHARIVVSADHGLTRVEPEDVHEIADGDPLLAFLRQPPSGEPRVPSFYLRHGGTDDFVAAFRERFGRAHALLTVDEVDALRLLGPSPLSPETRRRLGDFMAISASADAIVYRPDSPMLGFHGGLLPDEMRIPLIIV